MPAFGDPIDPVFLDEEQLYLRIRPDASYPNRDDLLLSDVRFPAFSVNRGKYSRPEDALAPNWPTWGVAAFFVRDIPSSLEGPTAEHGVSVTIRFHPVHCPELGNYAHSEVRSFSDGDENVLPSKVVRARFREHLRQRLRIAIQARAA